MIPEFRKMATEAGRDPESIEITVWFPRRTPTDEALPGPRRVARGVQPGVREGRRADAGDRWLGRADATGQRLSRRIPYGLDRLPRIHRAGREAACATVGDEPLRLNSRTGAAGRDAAGDWRPCGARRCGDRLADDLCGDYAPLRRQFIAAYFSVIATQSKPSVDLVERLNRYDGLYAPEDFLWSALMPLPRGWVPVGNQLLPADVVFWDGVQPIAIEIASRTTARQSALDAAVYSSFASSQARWTSVQACRRASSTFGRARFFRRARSVGRSRLVSLLPDLANQLAIQRGVLGRRPAPSNIRHHRIAL